MRAIWERLVEPGEAVPEDERVRARLVASILVTLIALGTLSATVQVALVPGFLPTFVVVMTAVSILAGAWALNRSGHGRTATLVTAAVPGMAAFAAVISNPADGGALAFAILGVIAASLLVSTRAGAVMAAATLAGVGLVVVVGPEVPSGLLAAMSAFLAICSLFVLVAARHRDRVEAQRRRDEELVARELQRADRLATIGTLAASIAHEVSNPLTFVEVNLHLLAERATDPEAKLLVDDAAHGIDQIASVVRTLSAFARGDGDKREPIDIACALEMAIRMAQPHIQGRARLSTRLGPVPAVEAGRHRLEQVFLNLLLNAAQAIPEDDPDRHQISVTLGAGADETVLVEIADTGAGIPAGSIERVFEPFFSTKPDGVGTGLGLCICRDIVTAFGGRISIDSVVGNGTTVRVSLPAAK